MEGSLRQNSRDPEFQITEKQHNGKNADLPARALPLICCQKPSKALAEANLRMPMPSKAPLPGPWSTAGHFSFGSCDRDAEVTIGQEQQFPQEAWLNFHLSSSPPTRSHARPY